MFQCSVIVLLVLLPYIWQASHRLQSVKNAYSARARHAAAATEAASIASGPPTPQAAPCGAGAGVSALLVFVAPAAAPTAAAEELPVLGAPAAAPPGADAGASTSPAMDGAEAESGLAAAASGDAAVAPAAAAVAFAAPAVAVLRLVGALVGWRAGVRVMVGDRPARHGRESTVTKRPTFVQKIARRRRCLFVGGEPIMGSLMSYRARLPPSTVHKHLAPHNLQTGPAQAKAAARMTHNTVPLDAPRHSAVLLMDLAVTVAFGCVQPRSNPQSSCLAWLVVKYSDRAASAPVMPVTPSARHIRCITFRQQCNKNRIFKGDVHL